jgi:glucose-6-phosphate 1-epimerase
VLTSIARPRDADARVSLQLTETPRSLDIWQHRFAADLVVTVGGASLTVALTITNTDRDPFVFTAALHTYLRVSDIRDVSIDGLGGTRYQESSGGAQHAQTDDTLRIAGEVDRIYFDMPRPLRVRDGQRTTGVAMSGFSDVVIWNPGAERGAALADLEPGGYARFVCVEAAAIGTPIELARGEQWTGSQTLTAE